MELCRLFMWIWYLRCTVFEHFMGLIKTFQSADDFMHQEKIQPELAINNFESETNNFFGTNRSSCGKKRRNWNINQPNIPTQWQPKWIENSWKILRKELTERFVKSWPQLQSHQKKSRINWAMDLISLYFKDWEKVHEEFTKIKHKLTGGQNQPTLDRRRSTEVENRQLGLLSRHYNQPWRRRVLVDIQCHKMSIKVE